MILPYFEVAHLQFSQFLKEAAADPSILLPVLLGTLIPIALIGYAVAVVLYIKFTKNQVGVHSDENDVPLREVQVDSKNSRY